MSTTAMPANMGQALGMLQSAMRFLADADAAEMPTAALAEGLRGLEQADAIGAAARGRFLAAFDAKDGHLADGQRTCRTWLVHCLRVTRGQAAEHRAVAALTRDHPALIAGLREGHVITRSVALQLAKWTRAIPAEFREEAEEFLVAAARAGADLRMLARFTAEIRQRTAVADPDEEPRKDPDRGLTLDTTLGGAGVLRGDLTPEAAAMVQAVLDALSAPEGGDDLRTRPERYHDALAEAMKRLLAAGLLPQRAGQPVKALVHIYFDELREMDPGSVLQDKWIAAYRAAWAGHRAAASVGGGDGGAWLEGDAARAIAGDALIIPVVTGNIDPGALEELITACAQYHRLRARAAQAAAEAADTTQAAAQAAGAAQAADIQDAAEAADTAWAADIQDAGAAGPQDRTTGGPGETDVPGGPDNADGISERTAIAGATAGEDQDGPAALAAGATEAGGTGTTADVLAMLEHQILGTVIRVVSGPGGIASFLRQHLLGKPLGGPSLPLDVGQSDDIPVHLRRLVALRDQTCQYPGGCNQPASGCEPHHVIHRADGGHTSLTNLKDYCWWHHHVVLHQMGWKLTVHPDGTSQVRRPDGTTIHSHSPPPRP